MWLSVAFVTTSEHAERLSEALLDNGALSVGIEDADAGTERETPQFDEPAAPGTAARTTASAALWSASRVVALFEPAEDLTQRLLSAAIDAGLDAPPPFEITEVAEQNWVQLTQSQFQPIRISDKLWIVPSWHEAPDPHAINLVLDPGMAFGTGSHPTTFLCLGWLCEHVGAGDTVLDYGCGSGILGVAAVRLGAARVVGVDIDEKALDAARDNAHRNAVSLILQHSSQPLAERFDRVVANILTNPLCVLAPLLSERVAPGGRLALSGVLETQAQQVIDAYAPHLALHVEANHEGWVLLGGSRPAC